ncbi:MAG: SRPBCC domain-containing protein [Planctomycetes bacterium]|nr:SRPBCC domain-containing protein [Planctomycetota bacterium]
MRNVIQQSIVLPAPSETLFENYLDPAAHAAITGWPVTIGPEPGAEFRAFDVQLSGRILAVVRPSLIVQSWRSTKFLADNLDSTLILAFVPESANAASGRIDLVHPDVPDHDFEDVTEGWPKYYWTPWREYLERRKKG